LQLPLLPPHACGCGSSNLLVCSQAGDQAAAAAAAAAAAPLLDVLARDVVLRCSSCGARYGCCFLSGLRMFQHRTTYSSAGGPWCSSSSSSSSSSSCWQCTTSCFPGPQVCAFIAVDPAA
jgi:hypothetical protein